MTRPDQSSQFAAEAAVRRQADGLWLGELYAGWRIGAVPNGGYVLAVAGRALSEAYPANGEGQAAAALVGSGEY